MDAVQAVAVLSLLLMIRRRNDNFRLRIRTILYCLLIQRRQDSQRLFYWKDLQEDKDLVVVQDVHGYGLGLKTILKSCCQS